MSLLTERLPYVRDAYARQRRMTRTVMVGNVGVGGLNPIRVQSMTTTRTQDVEGTTAQAIRLIEAGCEIVRITAPTVQDARAIGAVRKALRARGLDTPLVADIHFSPEAAMEAANHVEKVRVNPGNYADSRKFAVIEYTDAEYHGELERIAERFSPLVRRCKELGIAMRVGTNHGSLSDRIMNRFGDTPLGMVESALEFLQIARDEGYYDIILSMKASNPKVMIQAYRLLVARMDALGWDYPLHLGVTEAGNGEDGRIKSAVGIGSLLDDGLGDTIRVSLTEDPVAEIPVAQRLASWYNDWPLVATTIAPTTEPPLPLGEGWGEGPRAANSDLRDPYNYERRYTRTIKLGSAEVGAPNPAAVILELGGPASELASRIRALREGLGAVPLPDLLLLSAKEFGERAAFLNAQSLAGNLGLGVAVAETVVPELLSIPDGVPVQYSASAGALPESVTRAGAGAPLILLCRRDDDDFQQAVGTVLDWVRAAEQASRADLLVGVELGSVSASVRGARLLAARLQESGRAYPLMVCAPEADSMDDLLLAASISLGSPLCDGLGDAVQIRWNDELEADRLAFNVLQACGARITKTEYVACPGCGRTLFDLQPTTDRIKSKTDHLIGVKIAVMGCIVNGPGEMADADFGYVGGAPGKVNLYVGKECVEKNVPQADADERLIELIREHGRWVEPTR